MFGWGLCKLPRRREGGCGVLGDPDEGHMAIRLWKRVSRIRDQLGWLFLLL